MDSNDILYGAEPEFQQELVRVANTVVDDVMTEMKTLGESQDKSVRTPLLQVRTAFRAIRVCLTEYSFIRTQQHSHWRVPAGCVRAV